MKLTKHANKCKIANVAVKYKVGFPSFTESTLRGWLKKYRSQPRANLPNSKIVISAKIGALLYLPEQLDKKFHAFITHLGMTSGTNNLHVAFGVLMGLIKSDLITCDMYLKFQIADEWIQSFYRCMHLYRRIVTTLRPTITRSIWLEVQTHYLDDIVDLLVTYNIPNEFIIKVDQTTQKYVPIENVTMVEKNSKHIGRKGANDKRGITVTLAKLVNSEVPPMQHIYKGKTNRSLPAVEFPESFVLTYYKKHWSNEEETLNLIQNIICPQIKDVKKVGAGCFTKIFAFVGCI